MSEINFSRILNNTATDVEKEEFYKTLENNPELNKEYHHYKNLYVLSSLNLDNYQDQQRESFTNFWKKVHTSGSGTFLSIWTRYAAIFLLAMGLGYLANYIQKSSDVNGLARHIEYNSEKGSISTIHLEDGSAIWLSSGTSLVVDQNRNGETIAQLNGEAYFDLTPNPNRKFTVDLGHFKVRDIGTTFNIRSYKSEKMIMATLVTGQIDLIKESGESFLTVKPGELVNYDKSTLKMTVNQQDPLIVTAWKDGKFVFIDQPLSDICKELENWYNVEIQIDDPKLAKTRYTSVVKRTTTIELVLKILAITDHIKYEITNKKEGKDFIRIRK